MSVSTPFLRTQHRNQGLLIVYCVLWFILAWYEILGMNFHCRFYTCLYFRLRFKFLMKEISDEIFSFFFSLNHESHIISILNKGLIGWFIIAKHPASRISAIFKTRTRTTIYKHYIRNKGWMEQTEQWRLTGTVNTRRVG